MYTRKERSPREWGVSGYRTCPIKYYHAFNGLVKAKFPNHLPTIQSTFGSFLYKNYE